MNKSYISIFFCALTLCLSCKTKTVEINEQPAVDTTTVAPASTIKIDTFGILPNGKTVKRYTLTNKNQAQLQVINYGGIVTALKMPDRNGNIEDVVLGYDSLAGYLRNSPYFGCLIGRFGNRIAKGKFKLDNQTYTLAKNNNGEHLHGGTVGFDKVYWDIEEVQNEEGSAVKLSYVSKDMEEGFPGTLTVEVQYVLTDKNEWKIYYTATTDKKTIVNLTQHSYFNLTGNTKGNIEGHEFVLEADKFLPVNKTLIPTGELKDVKGTPFDFRKPKKVGKDINAKNEQLTFGKGYDHCWVLSSKDSLKFAASVYDSLSGRFMEIHTTEPAFQFYSGNFLDGTIIGKYNVPYTLHYAMILETQHYPDSPNKPEFPSVVLNPQETYRSYTVHTFSVK